MVGSAGHAGLSGVRALSQSQWQPTLTVHDPSYVLTLLPIPSLTANAGSATAAWVAHDATAIPGAVTVAAGAGTAVWVGHAATVVPGAVTVAAGAGTAAWVAHDATAGATSSQTVAAGSATVAWVAHDAVAVFPGEVIALATVADTLVARARVVERDSARARVADRDAARAAVEPPMPVVGQSVNLDVRFRRDDEPFDPDVIQLVVFLPEAGNAFRRTVILGDEITRVEAGQYRYVVVPSSPGSLWGEWQSTAVGQVASARFRATVTTE